MLPKVAGREKSNYRQHVRKTRALLLVWITSMSISAIACSSAPSSECDCVDNTVQIHIPADLAAAAEAPVLSMTCAAETLTCTQEASAGGCETYAFTPTVAGPDCHIEIDFTTGHVFTADLQIVQETGCCAGFFVDPISAADVEVPEGT
jgi:hypothetical protein